MSNEANTPTETLTDDMIRALRDEAGVAGDESMQRTCNVALGIAHPRDIGGRQVAAADAVGRRWHVDEARSACAAAITNARAMDDSNPFVRVVA